MATKKFIVLTAVDFNNERFEPGDSLELDEKRAKELLDVNAIALPQEATDKESKKK